MHMVRAHTRQVAIHQAAMRQATTRLHWARLPTHFYRHMRRLQITHTIMECLDIPAGSWLHLSGRKRKQTERYPRNTRLASQPPTSAASVAGYAAHPIPATQVPSQYSEAGSM